MDLDNIRQEIDHIDSSLVELLEKRMELVTQVVAYKKATGKAIFDEEREAMVLEQVVQKVSRKAFEKTIVATFADIMQESRNYQAEQLK